MEDAGTNLALPCSTRNLTENVAPEYDDYRRAHQAGQSLPRE